MDFWLTIAILGASVSVGRYLFVHILATDARARSPDLVSALDCTLLITDGLRQHAWIPAGKRVPSTFTRLVQLRPDKVGNMAIPVRMEREPTPADMEIVIGPVPAGLPSPCLIEVQLQVKGDGSVSPRALVKKGLAMLPIRLVQTDGEALRRLPVRAP